MVKNLRELRKNAGLSQQQLADILGTSQQSINKYENHAVEPDIETLITMAKLFNTSVDYLIGNTCINHIIEPTTHFDLNCDEEKLLTNYRKANLNEKSIIQNTLNAFITKKKDRSER